MAVKRILLLTLTLLAPALAFGNGGECTVYPSGKTQTGTAAFGRADCADSTNDNKPLPFDAHLEKSEEVLSGKTQADTAAFGGQAASGSAACTSCSAGMYSTLTGRTASTTCQHCPTGKLYSEAGVSVCTSCTAGKFQSVTGSTSCSVCVTDFAVHMQGEAHHANPMGAGSRSALLGRKVTPPTRRRRRQK